jgi:MYXO-CTERM domain-containing protein
MNKKLIIIAAVFAGSILMVGTASAQLIAGWDFSQYTVDGALTTDGSTFVNSLAANYSSLDATNNAGAESATYGTFHIDGSNGSTSVNAAASDAAVIPSAAVPGSPALTGNLYAPAMTAGTNPFNSFSILVGEGQSSAQELGLTARGAADLVFEAGEVGVPRPDWGVSFVGRTVSGSSTVGVEFSTNCGSYSSLGSVSLTETEQVFNLTVLPGASTDVGCVRLSLDPSGGQPIIDNVAVVPEPGSGSLAVAGVLGLIALSRRRRS